MTAYIPLGDWCERLSKRLSDGLSDGLSEGELDMLLLLDFQHDVVQNILIAHQLKLWPKSRFRRPAFARGC